ncbi:putative UspA domain protein [metagenome]|uniref:Putative UspA domain protein n=1 Tax=metagenome TaxID=256318 RepID=A0A2P2C5G1_9ZZZZ
MLNTEPRNVMVCVTPGEDCDAALEYAVAQARLRECRIHLVTAIPAFFSGATGADYVHLTEGQLRRYGPDLFVDCEDKIRKLSDGTVDVSTRILHQLPVQGLVAESENAALVVLQHHRMHQRHHLPARSTTNGVAARAHAPVVAVPDDWHEADQHANLVAVAVEDAVSSAQVVRAAFEEARRLGAELHLVRAWFFSEAFDRDVFVGEAGVAQSAAVREELVRDFTPIAGDYPDVTWSPVVEHGRPADVLVAQSELARLLVVGRHDPVAPLGSHLGPVTRPVLTHAACPVLVIDPRP